MGPIFRGPTRGIVLRLWVEYGERSGRSLGVIAFQRYEFTEEEIVTSIISLSAPHVT